MEDGTAALTPGMDEMFTKDGNCMEGMFTEEKIHSESKQQRNKADCEFWQFHVGIQNQVHKMVKGICVGSS